MAESKELGTLIVVVGKAVSTSLAQSGDVMLVGPIPRMYVDSLSIEKPSQQVPLR